MIYLLISLSYLQSTIFNSNLIFDLKALDLLRNAKHELRYSIPKLLKDGLVYCAQS